jgi:mono/diheme cytochrome c family protein
MPRTPFLLLFALLSTISVQAEDVAVGREKFKVYCMSCHQFEMGPQMVAPPIFAVKNHYLQVHPEKVDFVRSVKTWVPAPTIEKSLMPGAVRRFNLMPPLALPEEDLEAIATFLYEANLREPGWYHEHYRQEHGAYPSTSQ